MHANRTKSLAMLTSKIFEETRFEVSKATVVDEIILSASGGNFSTDYMCATEEESVYIRDYLVDKCGYVVIIDKAGPKYRLTIEWD